MPNLCPQTYKNTYFFQKLTHLILLYFSKIDNTELTCVWEDKSKPENIFTVIILHSYLHIVARQEISIAKKSLLCAF